MWQQRKIQRESEQSLINNPNDKVNSLNKFSSDSELLYLTNSVTLAHTTSHSDTMYQSDYTPFSKQAATDGERNNINDAFTVHFEERTIIETML